MTALQRHNGHLYGTCYDCKKWVRIDKALFGSLHVCLSDCELAGEHLKLRSRRSFWRRREWSCCDACGWQDRP